MERSGEKGLSGYALKYIALVSMLCDHANLLVIRRGIFAPFTTVTENGSFLDFTDAPAYILVAQRVYGVFAVLGHLAFPLFVFLITESFAHTRSKGRYLLTLLAFAVVTEPIYDLAHYGVFWNPALQNVLFTLTVSVGLLWLLELLERRYTGLPWKRWCLSVLAIAAAGGAAFVLRGEYVFLGTTAAALFWLLRGKGLWQLLGLVPLLAASPWVLLAALVLLMYNGLRGCRGSKYFFYAFYPVHFLVLMGLGRLLAGGPGT